VLQEAIEQVLKLVETSFRNQDIAIGFEKGEDIRIEGYPNEFSQVILNALVNAKDAITGKKLTNGRITVAAHDRGNHVVVVISDNAGGIPGDVLPRIFDPYFTTKEKGTGIGLYMSKMIVVDHMGGDIEARNTPDGAEIVISLPKPKRS